MSSIEERLAALEQIVAGMQHSGHEAPSVTPGAEPYWILRGLQEKAPRGVVAFAGHVGEPAGPVEWQWERPTDELLDQDWGPATGALEALAHPVRLHLLQRVLNGAHTTAGLATTEELGTTGQLHHHLRTLVSAGWLESPARGKYRVPGQRIIPLLVIISATA